MTLSLAFDVYGTLIDTSGVFDTLQSLVGQKAKACMDTWRNKQLEYSFRRGLMDRYVDFSQVTREALAFSCNHHNIRLEENQIQQLLSEYTTLPCFPDVKEGIEKIKKEGHKIYAFSNGSHAAIHQLLKHSKILELFDGIVSVESVKMFKPSPKVYQHFNDSTDSKRENSWLISGNPFDVMGAISYGMKAVWLKRSSDKEYDTWGIWPTKEVANLIDLKFDLDKK